MLEKVKDIAKEAGKIIIRYQKSGFEVKTKGGKKYDLVTTADIEADKFIRKRLQEEFPSDEILSEETEDNIKDYYGRVWVVDPIDGTKIYAEHKDGFCIIIGLCINGTPSLGIVYDPVNNDMYYAEKGKGAYLQKGSTDKKLMVSRVNSVADSRAFISISHERNMPFDKLADFIKLKERLHGNSFGIKIMRIALGEAEFLFDGCYMASKWDTCGVQIILEEAGGKITDLFGNTLNYKQKPSKWELPFIASNDVIHNAVIKEVEEYIEKNK